MPKNLIDLSGEQFGRWTVLERAPEGKRSGASWLCQCDCGTEKVVHGEYLRNGESRSCGCLPHPNSVAHTGVKKCNKCGNHKPLTEFASYRHLCNGCRKRPYKPMKTPIELGSGMTAKDLARMKW